MLTLLEFANDTLVSMYPPEPRSKVVSMWLIHTVMRVAGHVQPGSCVSCWCTAGVVDQYQVFTAWEYAFDMSVLAPHLQMFDLTMAIYCSHV